MSDPSAANAIRSDLGWTKREAMVFVRLNKEEAFKHAKDQNVSVKEALIQLARNKGKDSIEQELTEKKLEKMAIERELKSGRYYG